MSTAPPSSSSNSAWLVLTRKELRASLPAAAQALGFALLLGLIGQLLGFDPIIEAYYREFVLFLLLPLLGGALGGASVATERAEGTLHFLAARATSRLAILGTKLAWHGATLILAWLAALLVVNLFPASASSAWLQTLQVPAQHAAYASLVLAVVLFLCAFAASLLLDDPITATLAGLIGGAAWIYLVLALAAWVAGSLEVAFSLNPWLGLGVLVVPAALVAILVLGSRSDASTSLPRIPLTVVTALLALLAWLPLALVPNDIGHIRAAREGQGRVDAEPLLAHPYGTAVAFVITTTRRGETRKQAAIAFIGSNKSGRSFIRRISAGNNLLVLPPGTVPIGWSERSSELIVEWPGGSRCSVRMDGSVTEATGALAPSLPRLWDPTFSVHGGRLVVSRKDEDIQLYPPPAGGAS